MKANRSIAILFTAVALTCAGGAAAENKGGIPECKKVVKVCKKANYRAGDKAEEGRNLWRDCVNQLAAGNSVDGVEKFSAKRAKACKKARKAKKQS